MSKRVSATAAVVGATTLALLAAAAQAQTAQRAWVSGHGADAAGCGAPTSPCRSLQYVHDHIVAAGGEIDVLDPAGYGALTITKSLSVINTGAGIAGIQATSGDAITVSAGPNDVVTLIGLVIEGNGLGEEGIDLFSAKTANIRNCLISRFLDDGVISQPTAPINISVSDSIITDNGGDGIGISPIGTGSATATLSGLRVEANTARNLFFSVLGTTSGAGVKATVVQSALAGSVDPIVVSSVGGSGPVSVSVDGGLITNSNTGIFVSGPNSVLFLSRSTLSGNVSPCSIVSGGTINSYGDNALADNHIPNGCASGTLTDISLN